jgi:hypothetical protein
MVEYQKFGWLSLQVRSAFRPWNWKRSNCRPFCDKRVTFRKSFWNPYLQPREWSNSWASTGNQQIVQLRSLKKIEVSSSRSVGRNSLLRLNWNQPRRAAQKERICWFIGKYFDIRQSLNHQELFFPRILEKRMANIFGRCNRLYWVKCQVRSSCDWLTTKFLSTGDRFSWRNFGTLWCRSCFPVLRLRRYSNVHGSYHSKPLLPFDRQCCCPRNLRHSKRIGSLFQDYLYYLTLRSDTFWSNPLKLFSLHTRNQSFRSKDLQHLDDSHRRRN